MNFKDELDKFRDELGNIKDEFGNFMDNFTDELHNFVTLWMKNVYKLESTFNTDNDLSIV